MVETESLGKDLATLIADAAANINNEYELFASDELEIVSVVLFATLVAYFVYEYINNLKLKPIAATVAGLLAVTYGKKIIRPLLDIARISPKADQVCERAEKIFKDENTMEIEYIKEEYDNFMTAYGIKRQETLSTPSKARLERKRLKVCQAFVDFYEGQN